jgi:hypothetical protein
MKCGQLAILTEVMKQTDHLFIGGHFLMDSQTLKQEFKIIHEFDIPDYQTGIFFVTINAPIIAKLTNG